MCGLAGVVVWDDRYHITREQLARMSARIAHRGPDGEGTYLNHENEAIPDHPQVGLVHRRLAILDPDPHANQPFTDHLGRWIVFNGEIYNFHDLRTELTRIKPDYQWRTNCDTEALLIAYDVWGEICVEKLNGMFAFAIWDEPKKELFLARDRMGQKPLYVAYKQRVGGPAKTLDNHDAPSSPAAVAFASELGALCQLTWLDTTVDQPCLSQYLTFGYIFSGGTIYRGARKLGPGERLRVGSSSTGFYSQRQYFFPNVSSAPLNDDLAVKNTRTLVEQAVRRQLLSDVPLGCFLSGGIDSSIVAAAMRTATGSAAGVQTFSIGFDDPRYDESKFASQVAAHLGTTHHQFMVRPNAAEDLPKLARVYGEPFADSSALPTHYLAMETRKYVKVALSGDGGDELFGGYERYRAMAIAGRFQNLPRPLRMMISARLWQNLPGVHPKSKLKRLKRLLATLAQPSAQRYLGYVSLFEQSTLRELMGSNYLNAPADDYVSRFEVLNNESTHDDVRTAMLVDRLTYLPEDLHTKVDRASMLHALEVRSPFMDHELVQFAAGLTTDQLLKGGGKRMLREAFAKDLPAWVFTRRKMGFAVPIGDWFRGELRSMLRDHLFAANSFAMTHFNKKTVERLVDEHERQRVDHSQRLYALLMLELWGKNQ